MPSAPLLSLVIPTRNEAQNIGPLWSRLQKVLSETDFELIIVDDSEDETADLLTQLSKENRKIRCLLRSGESRQGGLSTAVVEGLHLARGKYVCIMDSDLQHPPELIPELLRAALNGADLAVASRYTKQGSTAGLGSFSRRLVSRSAKWLAQILFPEARRSSDPLSGYFLARKSVIDGIEFRPVGFKVLLEILVLIPNLEVANVPLVFEARQAGQSKASLSQGLMYLRHLKSLILDVDGSARALKFSLIGVSGLAIFLTALLFSLAYLHMNDLLAFLPAFVLSAIWNSIANQHWTFADQNRPGLSQGPTPYLRRACLVGFLMFFVYAAMTSLTNSPVVAALSSALIGMIINGLTSLNQFFQSPLGWASIATDLGVQEVLSRLTREIGADRVYLLPPKPTPSPENVPPGLFAHAVATSRPILWVEAPSFRPQRRTNIAGRSFLVIPVVSDQRVVAVLVCQRYSPTPFSPPALTVASHAGNQIASHLASNPTLTPA